MGAETWMATFFLGKTVRGSIMGTRTGYRLYLSGAGVIFGVMAGVQWVSLHCPLFRIYLALGWSQPLCFQPFTAVLW